MLKLATIIDNPGEPPVETRYRDPKVLRDLGYNGIVVYETTGLSGVASAQVVRDGEMRQWIARRREHVRQTIDAAREAGLAVYIFYDVLVLAADLVARHADKLTCRNRERILCPASDGVERLCGEALEALIDGLGPIDGVVLRFGDTDAPRLPYLMGNDLYKPNCTRCSSIGRADRVVRTLSFYHDLVVNKLNKRLIARAWNVRPNGMHDSVELCRRIAERLPGPSGQGAQDIHDDRFMLSFKWTETDFWRYQNWNAASQVFKDRPILYELECQREFEGKGGVPNWQVPLWANGCPEMQSNSDQPHAAAGLAHAAQHVRIAGLLAWVRGGGWGGPFISNESWIDANVYAVPRMADDLSIEPQTVLRGWINDRLGISDESTVAVLADVLEHSPDAVLNGFYIGPLARSRSDGWHPNADWILDDLVDVDVAWRMIQKLPDDMLDEVIREKAHATERTAADRAALKRLIDNGNRKALDPLLNSLIYAESLYAALRDLLTALVAYRRYQSDKDANQADACRRHVFAAQANWNHHTQRCGSLPGAATAFREKGFWELTQTILTELG